MIPKQLFGYDIVDKLGEGAASVIYVVSEPKTHQLYALKHVIRRTEKEDRFIEQVLNEWEVSRVCQHAALRKSIDLKTTKKFLGPVTETALVMELVDGIPMDQKGVTGIPDVLNVLIQVGEALAAMHKNGYIHCDTKPGNILITSDGKVKLIDLGQACKVGTVKERVQGTPAFIAPEQARCKSLTEQTDVYNLGATLYWALTGRRVPTLLTVDKADRDIVREQVYPSPSELNDKVTPSLSKLTMACLRLRPRERVEGMSRLIYYMEEARSATR